MLEGLRATIREKLQATEIATQPVSGGSINDAWYVAAEGQHYFCKLNSASAFPGLFQNEIEGLRLLESAGVILTPQALQYGEWSHYQILLMKWIEPGVSTPDLWKIFGRQLAELHGFSSATCGLATDNYMGSIRQCNTPDTSWVRFFRAQRLQRMAERNAALGRLDAGHLRGFDNLYNRLPEIFEPEDFSLLHGDLWSGNFLVNRDSLPVLIDPAVYYGHRCIDLGMTMLFGGFDPAFYEAYDHHFPLPVNYKEQCEVCNLYPLLIHLELFGRSYLGQIETILKKYS